MIISITGTPGTGKTTLSEKLSNKIKMDLVKVNDFAKKNKMILGRDKERKSDIIDTNLLSKTHFENNTIIEGHLAHFARSDIIIVLRCDPLELLKRLKKRKWSNKKIRENLEAECLGSILSESMSKSRNVYELDTTKKSQKVLMDEAMEIIRGKRNKYKPKIDYLEKITEIDGAIKS